MGQYIYNLAMSLISQLHITTADLGDGAQSLYAAKAEAVKAWLKGCNPATVAKIALCGRGYSEIRNPDDGAYRTPMYLVHCGTYLGKYESGLELITEIACTAVIAQMNDILFRTLETENEGSSSQVPDRALHRAGAA